MLKLESVPDYENYHPKLLTQLTSKTAPDVFYVGDDNAGRFVAAGVLAPLNDLLASPDSKSKPDDFFEGLYGGAKKDGKVYGVPNDCNPEILLSFSPKLLRRMLYQVVFWRAPVREQMASIGLRGRDSARGFGWGMIATAVWVGLSRAIAGMRGQPIRCGIGRTGATRADPNAAITTASVGLSLMSTHRTAGRYSAVR